MCCCYNFICAVAIMSYLLLLECHMCCCYSVIFAVAIMSQMSDFVDFSNHIFFIIDSHAITEGFGFTDFFKYGYEIPGISNMVMKYREFQIGFEFTRG